MIWKTIETQSDDHFDEVFWCYPIHTHGDLELPAGFLCYASRLDDLPLSDSAPKDRGSADRETAEIDVVCAWCGERIGMKKGFQHSGRSHGMCTRCYNAEMSKLSDDFDFSLTDVDFLWEKPRPYATLVNEQGNSGEQASA